MPSWILIFRSHTFPTHVIDLDDEFLEYLRSDGPMTLPVLTTTPMVQESKLSDDEDWDAAPDAKESDADDDNDDPCRTWTFPRLEKEIVTSIDELGGAVFPRLNWSAPKDAIWVTPNRSLKCADVSDVFLLLKASDNVVCDVSHTFDHCEDSRSDSCAQVPRISLCLRKWYPLNPSMEFRCFVRERSLIGISQRNLQPYPFLRSMEPEIKRTITAFFEKILFGSSFPLFQYVFDIYISKTFTVKLVDFAPFGEPTNPLLFSWEALAAAPAGVVEIRFANDSASAISPSPSMYYGLPDDMVNMDAKEVDDVVDKLKIQNDSD